MSLSVKIKKRLRSFSLELDFETDGDSLGILGPSGCGKSMTLKCIAGVETPDEGRIVLDGRVLYDSSLHINLRPQLRRVGYLFQSCALFPNMTVAQNIASAVRHPVKREHLIAEAIKSFTLNDLRGSYPARLSGGQKQRVALARMLASEPEVILLDEPFSALDPSLREQMQSMFKGIMDNCGNSIMVTHSRDEAYRLCDKLLIIDDGAVVTFGGTKQIFASPPSVRAAELTGCRNFSRIEPCGENRVTALDWGLTLDIGEQLPHEACIIGIREHDFIPADGGENSMKIRVLERLESPTEYHISFTNAALEPEQSNALTWSVSKRAFEGFPEYLTLPKSALLLLRD